MERLLYEPITINNMSLKNRLVKSATYEAMAAEDGSVTDQLIDMYTSLAKGGVGLILTGYAYIQENGHCMPLQTGVFSDDNIPGLRKLVDAVNEEGGQNCFADCPFRPPDYPDAYRRPNTDGAVRNRS